MDHKKSRIFSTTFIDKIKKPTNLYRVKDLKTSGLYIAVKPSGIISWLYRYSYINKLGKKKSTYYTFGEYPGTQLGDARAICENEYRPLAIKGVNLKEHFTNEKIGPNEERFEVIYNKWYKSKSGIFPNDFNMESEYIKGYDGWSYNYALWIKGVMRDYVLPIIGHMNVKDITTNSILNILETFEDGKIVKLNNGKSKKVNLLATRDKCKGWLHKIMNYAMKRVSGIPYNVVSIIDLSDMKQNRTKKHNATVYKAIDIREVLQRIDEFNKTTTHGSWQLSIATTIAPLTLLRSNELAGLAWSEIDFNWGFITIPKERMKGHRKDDHIIPITSQLKHCLQEAKKCAKRDGVTSDYVFPKVREFGVVTKPISKKSLGPRLKYSGIDPAKLVPHGWRSMGSTRLNYGISPEGSTDPKKQTKLYNWDAVEQSLSHVLTNESREAYLRPDTLEYRREMMQEYCDYLDLLRGSPICNLSFNVI